ncbi:MAG: hypothetical protein OHK0046_00510 [Anaerolineae bacterium]
MNELKYTQNFLVSEALVEKLVALARIQPGETVLEIGPGKGIITKVLAARVTVAGRVVAVELDAALVVKLRTQFQTLPQVQISHQDIRQLDLASLGGHYLVFSNIPFNITSELLEYLFTPELGPERAYLILQQDALIATNAHQSSGETFKSFMLKPFYEIQAVHTFARSDFRPPPGVETALFAFTRRDEPLIPAAANGLYKDFLAYVSKDRVGEGNWKKVFSKSQLLTLTESADLVAGRGLKLQTVAGMVRAFTLFQSDGSKVKLTQGAMAALREEQKRREAINREGGHHRANRNRPPHKR